MAIGWAFGSIISLHFQAGRHDLQLALGVAVFLGFTCLDWFRDTALTVAALPAPSSPTWLSSIGATSRVALRAFPSVAPFFLFSDFPELALTLWRTWSGYSPPLSQALRLLLVTSLGELAFALAIAGCWGIAVAVAAAERTGTVASLARAWRLLAGSRWRFLAIYVVVIVAAAAPSAIAAVLMTPIAEALHLVGRFPNYFRTELEVAGSLGSVIAATWHVMIAVAYLELRRVKEGVVVGDVAEVFG